MDPTAAIWFISWLVFRGVLMPGYDDCHFCLGTYRLVGGSCSRDIQMGTVFRSRSDVSMRVRLP